MSDDLSPIEQFKQATSATLRSIAERDDIDVTFRTSRLVLLERAPVCRFRIATCRQTKSRMCVANRMQLPFGCAITMRRHIRATCQQAM